MLEEAMYSVIARKPYEPSEDFVIKLIMYVCLVTLDICCYPVSPRAHTNYLLPQKKSNHQRHINCAAKKGTGNGNDSYVYTHDVHAGNNGSNPLPDKQGAL